MQRLISHRSRCLRVIHHRTLRRRVPLCGNYIQNIYLLSDRPSQLFLKQVVRKRPGGKSTRVTPNRKFIILVRNQTTSTQINLHGEFTEYILNNNDCFGWYPFRWKWSTTFNKKLCFLFKDYNRNLVLFDKDINNHTKTPSVPKVEEIFSSVSYTWLIRHYVICVWSKIP